MNSPQMEKDRQEGPVKKHINQSYVFYPAQENQLTHIFQHIAVALMPQSIPNHT